MTWKLAVGQVGASLGDIDANLATCLQALETAADADARLLVLPELALTGYMFESRDEAASMALRRDGPEVAELAKAARATGVSIVVGLLERDGEALYNTALLLESAGRTTGYRKSHLPTLGGDRFLDSGDCSAPVVVETELGRIGLAVCYDLRFPESARCLALAGADVIAQPSNWPPEARMLADHFAPVRACENRVYLAIANRWDEEKGVHFMGRSQVVAPSGEVLADAGDGENVIVADVDVRQARDKSIVVTPGSYEVHLFDDRRPDLYTEVTKVRAL